MSIKQMIIYEKFDPIFPETKTFLVQKVTDNVPLIITEVWQLIQRTSKTLC